jgi:hypothetical protein
MMQRRLLILGAALLGCATAGAQTSGASAPPKYGVVSLLGDAIHVTGSRGSTGSRLDQNERLVIPMPEAGFDATALRTIEGTVRNLAPQSATLLFAIKSSQWAEAPTGLFEGDRLRMSPELIEAMRADGATHLLLLTNQRAETELHFDNGWRGTGRVEGLGFYIDRQQWVIDTQSRFSSSGFLAPHAYLRLSLVDLSNARVVRHQTIAASHIYTATLTHNVTDPWNTLDGTQKLTLLHQMIERELAKALGVLLEAS